MLISKKIKIGELFQKLGIDNENYNNAQYSDYDIYIPTPSGELYKINSFVKKRAMVLRIVLDNGVEFKCSENHLIIDASGDVVKIKDSNYVSCMDGCIKIVKKESQSVRDVYDISIDSPHIYTTPNGVIHHNTTTAHALCNDMCSDKLYINGSLETSIEILRYKVTQFASTSSMFGNNKIVFIDEIDRMSSFGIDALKGIIDTVEANCRFIFATNNFSKLSLPIVSRCDTISFNFPEEQSKILMQSYFKRIIWILEQEQITFDKKIVAEYIKKIYPDFRKILNGLQMFSKMYGAIDDRIIFHTTGDKIIELVGEIKNGKFNNIRKLCTEVNVDEFYSKFYEMIDTYLKDDCKPETILILANYAYQHTLSIDKEINLVACCIELVKGCKFK